MVRESLQQGATLDKAVAWCLYSIFPGLLSQCISVTTTRRKMHRPRGIRSIRDWAKEAALLTQAAKLFFFFLQLKRVESITLLHKALY